MVGGRGLFGGGVFLGEGSFWGRGFVGVTFTPYHFNFTTDKVYHSLKFITQPVVIEPKPFDFGYKS